MKKTQVALAALALVASTAVLADGVKVYGTLDAGISSASTTGFYGVGNNGTTQIGFAGTSDLDAGWKANFNLLAGVDLSQGSSGVSGGGRTTLFNRGANVGISNESVGIALGTFFSDAVLQAGFVTGGTAVGGDGVNVPAVVRLFGGYPGTQTDAGATSGSKAFFIPQAVRVNFAGGDFQGDFMTKVVTQDSSNSNYTAATVRTSVGGVNLAVGYQNAGYTSAASDYSSTFIAANTSVGDVRLNGAWSKNTGAADSNGYMMGVSSPIVGKLSGGVTFAKSTAALGSFTGFSLEYAMGGSTVAYATFAKFGVAGGGSSTSNAGITITGDNLTTVGLKHSF